jgi:hypothetical protein
VAQRAHGRHVCPQRTVGRTHINSSCLHC